MRVNLAIFCLVIAGLAFGARTEARPLIAPKVIVITMFPPETKPWLDGEQLTKKIPVPGMNADFPEVSCNAQDLCVITTGMGFANAASTLSALIYSPKFDLRRTYFIIDGIAGVDPKDGTLGSVHWARYAIDATLRHEIDPRQMPAAWSTSFLGLGAAAPGQKPAHMAGTEVYALNEAFLQRAYALSRNISLMDSPKAQAYRQHYDGSVATGAPFVSICDTSSADLYWHGSVMAEQVEAWSTLLSDGKSNYCTSQMEDNATLTALKRGSVAGLVDFDRVALLRSASNFDREGRGQTAAESLVADSGGFAIALTNGYRAGAVVAHAILKNWSVWSRGVPAN
jgi:purine nucleoside permease